jgi:hypothetical protein
MILFPYTMLSVTVFDSITIPFIILAVVQFPLYGVALGSANERDHLGSVAILLAVVHGVAVAALFLIVSAGSS